jgi:hypothetical protein
MSTPPHYGSIEAFGPFHRLQGQGETQLPEAARKQLASGEIWGCPSVNSGDVPIAQAHHGPLEEGAVGIEFFALAPPDKRWGEPQWRTPRADASGRTLVSVEHDATLGDVVKVKVAITRVTQVIG